MDNKTKLLERMFNKPKDQDGDTHYVAMNIQSMEFVGYMNMENAEYIQLLEDMSQESLIVINYNGRDKIEEASIVATQRGCAYLLDNGKNKIGF